MAEIETNSWKDFFRVFLGLWVSATIETSTAIVSKASETSLFPENSKRLKAVDYFHKRPYARF